MARIYVNCGEYDKAIDELDYLLSLNALHTVNELKLRRFVEPLRGLPRYKAMIKKYENNLGT